MRHNIELQNQPLQNSRRGMASSPVSKQIPVSPSSPDWSYRYPGSTRACSASFDWCCGGVRALGRGLRGRAGRGSTWGGREGTGADSFWLFSAGFARHEAHLVP